MNYHSKITLALIACVAFISAVSFTSCSKNAPRPPVVEEQKSTLPPTIASAVERPAATTGDIVGTWNRTDGNYRFDIKSVPSSGFPDIAYFNPDPIKIGNAHAFLENRSARLTVILNDQAKGYNGCIYKLAHDKKNDVLAGTYYQATMNQEYEVVFTRAK